MEIQGSSGVTGPQRVEPQRVSAQRTDAADLTSKVGDSAEISDVAQLLSKLSHVPEVRMERVSELKELIAAGRYESREKIEQAVDRILEEL